MQPRAHKREESVSLPYALSTMSLLSTVKLNGFLRNHLLVLILTWPSCARVLMGVNLVCHEHGIIT